ncbi:hypothetical protein LTR16_003350 [Cryomyces antarcticus]|uniref:PRISE-like Rossmann-fold domain-containing protein n=1 Tax=Cryomyces antarcticus TaxID=329879 RepID=A0ABR0LNY5_9PEZI|nr:hypothetical protein LTR16_003350 [Cryomyces antarcticus]
MSGNHALIFGASGISGWAITNALISGYPSPDSFTHITALTDRPLAPEAAQWPESHKVQVVSGLDLLSNQGQSGLEEDMKSKIKRIGTVTHVFFFAYLFNADPAQEIAVNVELLKRAVTATGNLSKNLRFVVLPTGTKAYGVHLLDGFPFPHDRPLTESLPRIPEPYASQNFYYAQTDFLSSLSASKSWSWCEVRPDVVVGFVPNNNVYCLAQTLATYLSLYVNIEGKGATCAFPGTERSWEILSNDSSQDIVAKFSIYASLHPEDCGGGQAFNVADNSTPSSWSVKWPIICDFFGLHGTPPPMGGSGPQPGQYLEEHFGEWRALEKERGLQTGRVGNERSLGGFQYFIMTMFDFDRDLDMKKMHKAWGNHVEETDEGENYTLKHGLYPGGIMLPRVIGSKEELGAAARNGTRSFKPSMHTAKV